MEIIQGKPKDKKIILAQEIAFAKVLAGNNKTLRDRGIKKLKKWLTVRGNGKWTFTEEEFIRIWTGLFYCMWMSDKFLIQEELAESISSLIHCFKKNSESALLFIKCFNERILMDWEGLDQFRIDKFNMLVRRFLRQTFVYCKDKDWDESIIRKLMGIFYNVILCRDNALGFVMHFISIYAEELAKVSKGKLKTKTVLTLIEPFVKVIARSKDIRIQREAEDFFNYLMRQTDTGIEFEEKFNAWKQHGFPGEGPHCMQSIHMSNKTHKSLENGKNSFNEDDMDIDIDDDEEEEEVENSLNEPLDPRAGSLHVYLPQIPIDVTEIINLFQKHKNSKFANIKGRRILNSLIQKFQALNRGKFPAKIRKDPILLEKKKKKHQSVKNALELMKFTQEIDEEPIKSREFQKIARELQKEDRSVNNGEKINEKKNSERKNVQTKKKTTETKRNIKNKNKSNNISKNQKTEKILNGKKPSIKTLKKQKISNVVMQEIKENRELKKKKRKNRQKKKITEQIIANDELVVKVKKKKNLNGMIKKPEDDLKNVELDTTPVGKTGIKRKILSNWQVQKLDPSSPEYYKIETPKIIRLERKIKEYSSCEENEPEQEERNEKNAEHEWKIDETPKTPKQIFPVFWEKAREKVTKKSKRKSDVFVNPFAEIQQESKSPGRRISFALDKNMAQENEQYLEDVKNSSIVPFDGSKKPAQSALKSGLAPSPINPFYQFKKLKVYKKL